MGKVIIAAGGTGGHIFPAIAFGQWLEREKKASSVVFVCGSRPLETEIYRSANIAPLILPIEGSPLGVRGIIKRAARGWGLAKSCLEMRKILKNEKPSSCFLFGGYVSFPALILCHLMKIPTVLHEQNSVLGKVARIAKKLGKPVANSGVPVRPFEMKKMDITDNRKDKKIVGVLGGSLASGTLTKILPSVALALPECLFLVLADKKDGEERENIKFIGRHWDMNPIFSTINLAICRGGASTLAELAAYQIPGIVIPWEAAADGHQAANAAKFAECPGNHEWRENEDVEKLISLISNNTGNPQNYKFGFHDEASEKLFSFLEGTK